MKHKKYIVCAMCTFLTLALCACGKKENELNISVDSVSGTILETVAETESQAHIESKSETQSVVLETKTEETVKETEKSTEKVTVKETIKQTQPATQQAETQKQTETQKESVKESIIRQKLLSNTYYKAYTQIEGWDVFIFHADGTGIKGEEIPGTPERLGTEFTYKLKGDTLTIYYSENSEEVYVYDAEKDAFATTMSWVDIVTGKINYYTHRMYPYKYGGI